MSGVNNILCEIFQFMNDKEGSGADAVHCITEGWMWNVPEYYAMTHEQMETGQDSEACYDALYSDLIEVLKGEG